MTGPYVPSCVACWATGTPCGDPRHEADAITIGSLFSGYGGLDQGVAAALDTPSRLAWVCEIDPAPARILAHHHPDVPNLGDITAVRWDDVEPVDVLTGGFPCQDLSLAGGRAGLREDTRSGLWSHMARAIDHMRPHLVVIENVRGLLSAAAHSDVEPCPWCVGDDEGEPALRALGAVLADLADIGYDAAWTGIRAADVGAPHGRYRVFVIAWPAADADDGGREGWSGELRPGRRGESADGGCRSPADTDSTGREGHEPTPRLDVPARGAAPDAQGHGRDEGRPEPTREFGGPHAPVGGADPAADAVRGRRPGGSPVEIGRPLERAAATGRREGDRRVEWGHYAAAVHRWQRVLGRVAPAPTEPAPKGGQRLSPAFVEWMMGLPLGWVTGVPGITRNEQLKALGNGVVPQQAEHAVRVLLAALGVGALPARTEAAA